MKFNIDDDDHDRDDADGFCFDDMMIIMINESNNGIFFFKIGKMFDITQS